MKQLQKSEHHCTLKGGCFSRDFSLFTNKLKCLASSHQQCFPISWDYGKVTEHTHEITLKPREAQVSHTALPSTGTPTFESKSLSSMKHRNQNCTSENVVPPKHFKYYHAEFSPITMHLLSTIQYCTGFESFQYLGGGVDRAWNGMKAFHTFKRK